MLRKLVLKEEQREDHDGASLVVAIMSQVVNVLARQRTAFGEVLVEFRVEEGEVFADVAVEHE